MSIRWLSAQTIHVIHDDQIAKHGGPHGILGNGRVEAIVGRVRSYYDYNNPRPTVTELAAMYAEAIARGHAFVDGNKRTAAMSMIVFLRMNGIIFQAPEASLVAKFVLLADSKLSSEEFEEWICEHSFRDGERLKTRLKVVFPRRGR